MKQFNVMSDLYKTTILNGDCRKTLTSLSDKSINCCVTSPPYYGLRSYLPEGHPDKLKEIGSERTPEEYIENLVQVFREIKRILRDDGTLWLNIGDSYAGSGKGPTGKNGIGNQTKRQGMDSPSITIPNNCKPKDLIGIPWMLAFALRADGWYLRQDIIWHKPNPMPESVKDRCTKSHEYIFLLSKSPRYFYDAEAVKEPANNWGTRDRSNFRNGTDDPKLKHHGLGGKEWEENPTRNRRSVWSIPTKSYSGAHFAVFPPELIKPCILAGCPENGIVLDPFGGSGTTAQVSIENNRNCVICELNEEYIQLIENRI